MTDPTTQPIPILHPEDLRRLSIALHTDTGRDRDLVLAQTPHLLTRPDALTIAVRMFSRQDVTEQERRARRELVRRHGLSARQIIAEWRRVSGRDRPSRHEH